MANSLKIVQAKFRSALNLAGQLPEAIRFRWDTEQLARKSSRDALGLVANFRSRHPGRKLVVIGLFEHIGDIIACEPVVPFLRNQYPEAAIGWLINGAFRELLEHHPQIDLVLPVANLRAVQLFRDGRKVDHFFDLNLHQKKIHPYLPRYIKEEGDLSVTIDNYYHGGGLLESFSRGAGLSAIDGQPKMYLPDPARAHAASLVGGQLTCVIHPFANDIRRMWPAKAWETVVRSLLEKTGMTVIEVGANALLNVDHPRFRSLAGKLSLLESAAVIEKAGLYLGTDSGPAHMANAFGVRSVILLGPLGQFESYLPYSGYLKQHRHEMIIRAPQALDEISPAQVVERALTLLASHGQN